MGTAEKPPFRRCPVKGCGKKMAAFKRGESWAYICTDEPKHAQDKLAAMQRPNNKGGVKKGTPSPKKGRKKKKDKEEGT